MAQIKFSIINKIKIGRPEHLLPQSTYVRYHLIFAFPTSVPTKVDVIVLYHHLVLYLRDRMKVFLQEACL